MSSESCSSLGRLSFDDLEIPAKMSSLSLEKLPLKPHKSSDSAWEAIRFASSGRKDGLNFGDFKLLHRIGSGELGHVYLCRLRSSYSGEGTCVYAMKVVYKEELALKHKIERFKTEKRILKMLDHPFCHLQALPRLLSQSKEFDETKTGVKGLIDSGVVKVPRIFFNTPDVHLHLHEARSIQSHSHSQIPLSFSIIDLKEFITDKKDSSLRKEVVDQIRKASETWGFFRVLNHGIPTSVLEEMLLGIRRFFE
ncbi:hypothetical protein NE237_015996 [Protea cynaroides]|uniref:non-specific serine/threonine protein kinase n=1 Tax=Protea cynaroides TaxID=273540 RepID=A0A9Q0QRG4_9MAGN|nr:hypothetical protein NE237_015996 [Protea cynaroides]